MSKLLSVDDLKGCKNLDDEYSDAVFGRKLLGLPSKVLYRYQSRKGVSPDCYDVHDLWKFIAMKGLEKGFVLSELLKTSSIKEPLSGNPFTPEEIKAILKQVKLFYNADGLYQDLYDLRNGKTIGHKTLPVSHDVAVIIPLDAKDVKGISIKGNVDDWINLRSDLQNLSRLVDEKNFFRFFQGQDGVDLTEEKRDEVFERLSDPLLKYVEKNGWEELEQDYEEFSYALNDLLQRTGTVQIPERIPSDLQRPFLLLASLADLEDVFHNHVVGALFGRILSLPTLRARLAYWMENAHYYNVQARTAYIDQALERLSSSQSLP